MSDSSPPSAHLFGELAQELNLISSEVLDEALVRQADLRARRGKSRIGEILIMMEQLDATQVKLILSTQRKRRQADADNKLPCERFGDYKLIKRLGKGGMGEVFKVSSVLTGKTVALKFLGKNLGRNKENLARFEREMTIAKNLKHPNIVGTLDYGILNGIQFLVMEFIEGRTLQDYITEKGSIAEKETIRIFLSIARALEQIHKQALIHRDIKPENIMLDTDHTVKLCDMGTAKSTEQDAQLTKTGQIVGTPNYLSPEQALAEKNIGPRADFYSLGASMYHALTGRLPYEAKTATQVLLLHVKGELANPQDIKPELSDHVVMVLTKLMAKSPEHRYADATSLIEDLERVEKGEAPLASQLEQTQSVLLPTKTNQALNQKSGCLGLVIIGVACFWMLW